MALLAIAVALFDAAPAGAQVPEGAPASQPARIPESADRATRRHSSRVGLQIVASEDLFQKLSLDTCALLEQAGFEADIQRRKHLDIRDILEPPPGESARARAFVDLSDPSQALLIVADDARGRISIRRLPRSQSQDDILIEEILQIIRSSLGAIVAGAEFGAPREAAARQLSDLARPAAEEEPDDDERDLTSERTAQGHIDVTAFVAYDVGLIAGGPDVAHGPRLGSWLTLGDSDALGWGIALEVAYRLGPAFDSTPISGRLDSIPLRLGGMVSTSPGAWVFSARAMLGSDIVLPSLEHSESMALQSDAFVDPALQLVVRLDRQLSEDVGLVLDFGVDLYPWNARYLFRDAFDRELLLFEPWPARPFFGAGFRFF